MIKKSFSSLFVFSLLTLIPYSVQAGELHEAIKAGDSNRVKYLIVEGADVNAVDEYGRTPLHVASILNLPQIAKLLIAVGADVNVRDNNDVTPLHSVSFEGNIEFARLLIENRADVNARAEDGSPPLHWATWGDHPKIVRILILYGADSSNVLNDAIFYGSLKVLKLFVANGVVKINRCHLKFAKETANQEVIDYLQANKADSLWDFHFCL